MGYFGPAVKISHPIAEFLPFQAPVGIIQSRSINTEIPGPINRGLDS
jgi:hypothetical protein